MALCVNVNACRCVACCSVLLEQFLGSFQSSSEGVEAKLRRQATLSLSKEPGHQAGKLPALIGELGETSLENLKVTAIVLPNEPSRKGLRMRGRGRRRRARGLRKKRQGLHSRCSQGACRRGRRWCPGGAEPGRWWGPELGRCQLGTVTNWKVFSNECYSRKRRSPVMRKAGIRLTVVKSSL